MGHANECGIYMGYTCTCGSQQILKQDRKAKRKTKERIECDEQTGREPVKP